MDLLNTRKTKPHRQTIFSAQYIVESLVGSTMTEKCSTVETITAISRDVNKIVTVAGDIIEITDDDTDYNLEQNKLNRLE